MPETETGQTELRNLPGDEATEPGMLSIEEKPEETPAGPATTSTEAKPLPPIPLRALERTGTVEHIAARRPVPELQIDTPEIKQQLVELRSEVTRLVTGLRWGGESVDATAERMLPLLDIGPIPQWRGTLLPFLREIDRAGNLVPVWLKIIEMEEPDNLPFGANPAETPIGRARRYATLMLGYYKSLANDPAAEEKDSPAERPVELRLKIEFEQATRSIQLHNQDQEDKTDEPADEKETDEQEAAPDLPAILGKLAVDPNLSLYATDSLVRLATTPALRALVGALKDAEGWAKVDIVDSCVSLHQARFYDLLLASGLERVAGLESYVAIPIYQEIPLERYLRGDKGVAPRLTEQSTLIFDQVIRETLHQPLPTGQEVPPIFSHELAPLTDALFAQARREPTWQNAIALHHLALLLGRYWNALSQGQIQDERITDSIGTSLPKMPEIERWLSGPGRDILLAKLNAVDTTEVPVPAMKVLGEIGDPRAIAPLIAYVEATREVKDRDQARQVAAACEALGRLGDRRALNPIQLLIGRVVNVERRSNLPRRKDNLPAGDAEIPGSIVYGAAIRACGQLGDSSALEQTLRATNDFDPFVRTQAIEALRQVDPTSSDTRSRMAARAGLEDPRDSVVKAAIPLAIQYRDVDAFPALQRIIDTRPELASLAYDALRRLA